MKRCNQILFYGKKEEYANSSNDNDTGFNIQKYVEKSLRLFKFHALMLIIVIGKMPVTTLKLTNAVVLNMFLPIAHAD
ncbi:hypothetical protein T07_4064 [Trichinella nelsoni]|uniref:Uncharacterized protein n=1 Tax=Trichinella nelsoni TaxID=6336 RepID=A0A0V0RY23_9BILA|nr:hypothetical protein T07_4064 [Trichinella nelsoni]